MNSDIFGSTRFYVVIATLLLIVAGLLRTHNLSETSLWLDEARAANNSRGGFIETITKTQHKNSSPVIYPMLLYLVQKIDSSSTAVRLPSAIASMLAILVILSLPRVGVDKRVAFLAASLLAFSASQIEYAQEVREYSVSVLFAAIMLYATVAHMRNDTCRVAFYAVMLLAPLVQYGLVLFAGAILLTLALQELHRHNWSSAVSKTYIPAIFLGIGGLFSLWLTLRYQWGLSTTAFYLDEYNYSKGLGDPGAIFRFLTRNTQHFLQYILPGNGTVALGIPALGLVVYRCVRGLACHSPLPQLAMVAVFVVILTSIAHVYPFGPIRQDLFLAPVVSLAFSIAYVSVSDGLGIIEKYIWAGMVFLLVLASGLADIRSSNPYREVENIKAVIAELDAQVLPTDQVYIYRGAKDALNFYHITGQNYVYNDTTKLSEYQGEFDSLIDSRTRRVWLVFSHAIKDREQRILDSVSRQWDIEPRLHARGASLYLAIRREDTSSSIGIDQKREPR